MIVGPLIHMCRKINRKAALLFVKLEVSGNRTISKIIHAHQI
uniref:Uncharacterized protein n=1 Tax=Arundo donax TaxID=35708 RepID=A0A0A9FLW7_ARUDO